MKQAGGSQVAAAWQRIRQKVDDGDLTLRNTLPLMRRRPGEQFRMSVLAPFEAFETRLRIKIYQEEAIKWREIQRMAFLSLSIATEVDLVSAESQDREQLLKIELSVRNVLEGQFSETLGQLQAMEELRPLLQQIEEEEAEKRATVSQEVLQAHSTLLEGLALELRFLVADTKSQGPIKVRFLRLDANPGDEEEPIPGDFSCIAVSHSFIACGTEDAYIYLFSRQTLEEDFYFPASALGGKGERLTHIQISPDEAYIAFATSSNQIIVGHLTGEECVVAARHDLHKCAVTTLMFAALQDAWVLLSGDEQGCVVRVEEANRGNPAAVVFTAESRIIQISTHSSLATVSSPLRTYIVNLEVPSQPVPVGSQPHRPPAPYGACLLSSGNAFVARANGCLWKADPRDGKVISTLKFPDGMQHLKQPSLLFPVGADHLLAVSDTHVVTLINASRVAAVCFEQLLPVICIATHNGHVYCLCHRPSLGVVVIQVDLFPAAISDIARSEEILRSKLMALEGTGRVSIEQDFEAKEDIDLLVLRCIEKQKCEQWELEMEEEIEWFCLAETVAREELIITLLNEAQSSVQGPLACAELQVQETKERAELKNQEIAEMLYLKESADKEREFLVAEAGQRQALRQEEAMAWLLLHHVMQQALSLMERMKPVILDEMVWRQRLKALESRMWQDLLAQDRRSHKPQWVILAEVQMRARVWQEEGVAWRLMLKELGQYKQFLDRMQMAAVDLQRKYFDGRSALMDREYDCRRRMIRAFAKSVLERTEQQINLEELHHRGQLYNEERELRGQLMVEGEKLKASVRNLLYERAFTTLHKLEQFNRLVVLREEGEQITELFQRHQTGRWGVLLATQAKRRKALAAEEDQRRQELYERGLQACTALLRLAGDREQLGRTETASRQIVCNEQLHAWRELRNAAKAHRSTIRKGFKKHRALGVTEGRARKDLVLQEQAVWSELLKFESRTALKIQEELARHAVDQEWSRSWAAVILPYVEWCEKACRMRLELQEDKFRGRWITQMGQEGQRRRIELFQQTSTRLFSYFEDYILAEEDDTQMIRNVETADQGLLDTANVWMVQLLALRDRGYLDILSNEALAMDTEDSYTRQPPANFSMDSEEEEEDDQENSVDTLHRISKLIWFYLVIRLIPKKDNQLWENLRRMANPGSSDEISDPPSPLVQCRKDSRQRFNSDAAKLLDIPLEELVLDMLMTVHAMGLEGRLNLDMIAVLCNHHQLRNAVICIQRLTLPSHRLPNPYWDPNYSGPNGTVHLFFARSQPEPLSTPGATLPFLDFLIVNYDTEAFTVMKRLCESVFTMWVWYLPYLFALWPDVTMVCCARIASDLSWRDVRRLCSKRNVREAQRVLAEEGEKGKKLPSVQAKTIDIIIPYLWQLAQLYPELGADEEFVMYLLTKLARRAGAMAQKVTGTQAQPLEVKWNPSRITAKSVHQDSSAEYRARYEAKVRGEKAADVLRQNCERMIRDILEKPRFWAFNSEAVAAMFVREGYVDGLRFLDWVLFFKAKLQHHEADLEDLLDIADQAEEGDDVWCSLLTAAHALSPHECNAIPTDMQSSCTAALTEEDVSSECTIFDFDDGLDGSASDELQVPGWDDEEKECLLLQVIHAMEDRLGPKWARDIIGNWHAGKALSCPLVSSLPSLTSLQTMNGAPQKSPGTLTTWWK